MTVSRRGLLVVFYLPFFFLGEDRSRLSLSPPVFQQLVAAVEKIEVGQVNCLSSPVFQQLVAAVEKIEVGQLDCLSPPVFHQLVAAVEKIEVGKVDCLSLLLRYFK